MLRQQQLPLTQETLRTDCLGNIWVSTSSDKAFTKGGTMASADPEAIVKEAQTIAVVGASNDPEKYSNGVASYLKEQGYRVIPVNPTEEEVLGEHAYDTVDEMPEEVDVVDVFLPPEKTPKVAEDAVRAGAKVLWLQEGIENAEA